MNRYTLSLLILSQPIFCGHIFSIKKSSSASPVTIFAVGCVGLACWNVLTANRSYDFYGSNKTSLEEASYDVIEFIDQKLQVNGALDQGESQKLFVYEYLSSAQNGYEENDFFSCDSSIYISKSAYLKIKEQKELLEQRDIFATIFHERGHIVYNHSHKKHKARFIAFGIGFASFLMFGARPLISCMQGSMSLADVFLIPFGTLYAPYLSTSLFRAWVSRKQEIEADQYVVDRLNDSEALWQVSEHFRRRAKKGDFINYNPFSTHPSDISRAEFFKIAAEKKDSQQHG